MLPAQHVHGELLGTDIPRDLALARERMPRRYGCCCSTRSHGAPGRARHDRWRAQRVGASGRRVDGRGGRAARGRAADTGPGAGAAPAAEGTERSGAGAALPGAPAGSAAATSLVHRPRAAADRRSRSTPPYAWAGAPRTASLPLPLFRLALSPFIERAVEGGSHRGARAGALDRSVPAPTVEGDGARLGRRPGEPPLARPGSARRYPSRS